MLAAMTLSDLLDYASKLWQVWAVIGTFVVGVVGWLSATFLKLYRLTKTGDDLKDAVERIETVINKELKYNGNRSMKDVLDSVVASLNRSEAWQNAILNQSASPMWRADKDGNMEWANTAFTRVTGYGLEHLSGGRWLDMVSDDDRERVSTLWDSCVSHARSFSVEFRTSPGDHTSDITVMHCQPFFAAQKQGGGLLGFNGTLTIQGQ